MKIVADVDAAAILESLSAGAQPGLRFVGGVRLGSGDAAVTRLVNVARYAVGIPRTAIDALGGDARLRERVEEALAARELPVVRRIDGIGKRIDVREFLRALDVARDASLLDRAGIGGDLVTLAVEVDVRGSGGVKIAEVVEVVFGDAEVPHRAVRVELGTRRLDGSVASPLDLPSPPLARCLPPGGGGAVGGQAGSGARAEDA